MGSYLPLFSISVEHLFFTQGMCPKLDFIPTHETARVLRNTNMLTRETINGIYVFYDLQRADALQLYAAGSEHPLNFIFKVFSHDPLFQNYTAPLSHKENAILYLDNGDVKPDKTGRLRLHDDNYVTEKDFRELDSPLFEDIRAQKDRHSRPVFLVNISITKKESNLLGDSTKAVFRNYYLTFRARETFWKYYLLGPLSKGNVYITDLNNETEFVSATKESLPDNRTALTIRSRSSIPLREKSDCRFQLREKSPEGGKVLIKRLPVASAHQFNREIIDKKEAVVSEIYINC